MGDDAGAPGLGRFPPIPRERDRCSTTRNTSRRRRTPPRDRPPRRSAERRGGTARFTKELARALWLGPRPRPTNTGRYAFWGRVLLLRRLLQGTADARVGDPRAPDLAHSEHAYFRFGIRIHFVETERVRRGEPSALPTGVGCRVSGALGSGHTSRSNLSPSFAYTEHPFVAAGRVSGLVPRSLLPTTKPSWLTATTPREKRGMPGTGARVLSAGETRFFRTAHAPP
jgi:hypothetical protein